MDKKRAEDAEAAQARILAEAKRKAADEDHPFDHPFEAKWPEVAGGDQPADGAENPAANEAEKPAETETKGPEVARVDPFSDEAEKPAETEAKGPEIAGGDQPADGAESPAANEAEGQEDTTTNEGNKMEDKQQAEAAIDKTETPAVAEKAKNKEKKAARKREAKAAEKPTTDAGELWMARVVANHKSPEKVTASKVLRSRFGDEKIRASFARLIEGGATVGSLAPAIAASLKEEFPELKPLTEKTIRDLWTEAKLPTSRKKKD